MLQLTVFFFSAPFHIFIEATWYRRYNIHLFNRKQHFSPEYNSLRSIPPWDSWEKKYYPCPVSMIDFHYMVADENKYCLNSAPIYWDEIIFDKIEYSKYSKARKWHQKQVLAFSHILNFFQKKLWLKSKWSMLCSNLITISFTVKGKIGLLPGQLYNNLTWTAISPKWDNTRASFFQYSSWSPCYCNVIVLFRSLRDCICFRFLL